MNLMTAPPLAMTTEQRAAMEVIARSTSLGHRKVVQAKALLLAADGVGNNDVARRCHQRLGAGLAPALRGRRAHRSWPGAKGCPSQIRDAPLGRVFETGPSLALSAVTTSAA
jgi:hypothetical protein